jgi:DNA-binding transcriptional LysR family regulator
MIYSSVKRENAMNRIEDLQAFVAVVDSGGLTAAARQLGRSLQSISRSLAALEREVGVELVHRTTRRSNPTDAGLGFHRRVSAALAEIEAARLETANLRAEATGLLRIAASSVFAPIYIVPALPEFLAAHPKIEVDLDLSDGFVDLVDGGYDLAIRIGELPDSSLKARLLANSRRVVFASPCYLSRHGRPKRPEDLARYQCLVRTAAREGNAWPFKLDGRIKTVKVAGRLRASGAVAVNEAAVEGLGIACAPLWQVRSLVDRGSVELLLTSFEPPPIPIHAVWPATRLLPAKTQIFVDFLAVRLKDQRL